MSARARNRSTLHVLRIALVRGRCLLRGSSRHGRKQTDSRTCRSERTGSPNTRHHLSPLSSFAWLCRHSWNANSQGGAALIRTTIYNPGMSPKSHHLARNCRSPERFSVHRSRHFD